MRLNKSFSTYAIALGVFGITNTEFGIVGILPRITNHFQISASQAGMLVSMFALIIAISGPFMTLLFSSAADTSCEISSFTHCAFLLSALRYYSSL